MTICLAAVAIAIRPEEHWRSIVIPETPTGQPARSATWRPILPNWVPWVSTAPHTTSSISPASIPERSIAAFSENEPSVGPGVILNAPLYARPIGVRAVETITASRDILISSSEHKAEPLRGQRGFALVFDLDRHSVTQQPLPRRFLLDRVKREAPTNPFARLHRRQETHAVETVIDGQFDTFRDQHGVCSHPRQQRQGQEAMGDGAAELRLRRCFGIDVDELMVVGRVGKLVDPCLIDAEPGGHTHLGPGPGADFVDGCNRHRRLFASV